MNDTDRELARRVFGCIDNTTLNATDNEESVRAFCRRTRAMQLADGTTVVAVCVYPSLVHAAVSSLKGSGIRVVSVAGAFPHGQSPLPLRVQEVRHAVEQGADEVDIVLNRGAMLAGDYDRVGEEVAAMRDACRGRILKVILETGELGCLVSEAAKVAIAAGADFIKTSTGKSGTGATPEAADTMLRVIAENVKINKKTVGFKAAGGIGTVDEALLYARMAKKILGDKYIDNHTFRIGTSRLTDQLYANLTIQTASV